jgi:cell division cycle 20-like protein 1, cofactor of APC complex
MCLTLVALVRRAPRKIPRGPFKVLDAPALQDDFYLNLVDWSSQNVLAVGLGACVYLWSACTCKVTKLVDLAPQDMVCSVAWSQRGTYLSIGTSHGDTRIFDVIKLKQIRSMAGHRARVGTMAWNSHLLSTGSRDRLVLQRDVRGPEPYVQKCVPCYRLPAYGMLSAQLRCHDSCAGYSVHALVIRLLTRRM